MARQYFAEPNTVTLDLFGGDDGIWIEVKETLNYGEQQRLAGASLTSIHLNTQRDADGDTEVGLDMQRHAILRLATWIVDWNLPGPDGKTVPVTRSAIENLHPDVAEEINRVLTDHIAALEGKSSATTIVAIAPATNSSSASGSAAGVTAI